MAREGIQYDQVAAVADALMGTGQPITLRTIRDRLGTGSLNTVQKHLNAWREARQIPAAKPALSPALTSAIAAEIESVVVQAGAEINRRLIQTQNEVAELVNAGESVEAERDSLAEQLSAMTRERDTLAGKAGQQADELAAQVLRIEREQQAGESARIALAIAHRKIEEQAERLLKQATEMARLRLALEDNQRTRIDAEQQTAVLAAKLEAFQNHLTQQLESHAEARQLLAGELQRATERITQAQVERDEARKMAAEAREHVAKLNTGGG